MRFSLSSPNGFLRRPMPFCTGFVVVALSLTHARIEALELLSESAVGIQGNNSSEDPVVSSDGRWVAFRSDASNLVDGDTNSRTDIFVKDRETGAVERVSVSSGGVEPDESCFDPAISGNGRFVSFSSHATNLVSDDNNGLPDVFLYDRETDILERVSVSTGGAEADSGCGGSSVSEDGRYVCFQSDATNLVVGDTNGARDVFVRDRQSGQTIRASTDATGAPTSAGSYSSNGKVAGSGPWIIFSSTASNLVNGDGNSAGDIFAKNLDTGAIERVSEDANGTEANGYSDRHSVSSDGIKVVFECHASNLVPGDTNGQPDIFLKDRVTGVVRRVSLGAGGTQSDRGCNDPVISADGSTLAFSSAATNLAPGDANGTRDTFVVYLANGEIRRVSVRADGSEGNDETYSPELSADGSVVVFMSDVQDLVPEDTNPAEDVFAVATIFQQPDHSVGRSATSLSAFGDGIYNLTGDGQTLSLVSRRARRLNGFVHLQNDGNAASDLISRGRAGNRFFKITSFSESGNVTASLTAGQLVTQALAPGQSRSLSVQISPRKSALSKRVRGKKRWLKKTISVTFSSTSTGGNDRSDLAILKAQHR